MAEKSDKKWYVMRAISGKETKVKEYIDTEIKNNHFGGHVSQVLIPTEKVLQIRNGKRIVKEKNYLPGYVLVEAELVGEIAHMLRFTPNVLGFLPDLDNPTPLSTAEVNRILGKGEEEINDEEELLSYNVGDSVKVIEGPFNDFTGTIEEVNKEKKKLTVTVKVFGRSTPLTLSYTQVKKE